MVYVVEESVDGFSYREINQQLAKENGELRQQLGQTTQEIINLRQEVHQRDVRILDLEHRVNELLNYQAKLNAIRNIISDVAIGSSTPLRALPSIENNTPNTTLSIREPSEYLSKEESLITPTEPSVGSSGQSPSLESSEILNPNPPARDSAASLKNQTTFDAAGLNTISEESDTMIENQQTFDQDRDSLDPHDVSSVPPLTAVPDRTMHTPSIWNCLDPIDDMFQSTPHLSSEALESTSPAPVPLNVENQECRAEKPKRGRGRPIQSGSRAKREVKFDEENSSQVPSSESRRYNLRKRSKT